MLSNNNTTDIPQTSSAPMFITFTKIWLIFIGMASISVTTVVADVTVEITISPEPLSSESPLIVAVAIHVPAVAPAATAALTGDI